MCPLTALRLRNEKAKEKDIAQFNPLTGDPFSCMVKLFNGKLLQLAFEAQQTCSHTFSCVGAWSSENTMEILAGTWCASNAYQYSLPSEVTTPINKAYWTVLGYVIVPLWEIMMTLVSLVPEKGSSLLMTRGFNFAESDRCSAQRDVADKLKCMMAQTKMLFEASGGKPDLSELSMTENKAHQLQSKLKDLHEGLQFLQGMETTQKEKFLALEQGTDSNPVSSVYNTAADDIPIPGPLTTSLISPPSANKYSHVAPGLKMMAIKLTDVIPEAKCNDGSSALAYVHEGTQEGKFHFHVSGGYFCNNKKNCRKRIRGSPMLGSTKGYEQQFDGSGIFDPDLGGLSGWTHAFVTYCSSDAWFGQVELDFEVISNTTIEEGPLKGKPGTYFRGYTMIDAMLKKYAAMGLGTEPGHELVVSGCSAGAIGVAAQADSLIERLEKYFPEVQIGKFHPPKLVVVLDNMPIISPEPTSLNFNGNQSLFEQSQTLVDFLYVQPGILDKAGEFLNKKCVAKKGQASAGACVYPSEVMKYIQTPNLVLSNLQDSFLLFNPYFMGTPLTPWQENLASGLDVMMRKKIHEVTKQQNQWAIGCNDHCLSIFAAWWRFVPPTAPTDKGVDMHTVSPKDMLWMTMRGDTGFIAMDSCKTWNCGCAGLGTHYQLGMMKQYCQNRDHSEKKGEFFTGFYDKWVKLPKSPDHPPTWKSEADDHPTDQDHYDAASDTLSASSALQVASNESITDGAGIPPWVKPIGKYRSMLTPGGICSVVDGIKMAQGLVFLVEQQQLNKIIKERER